MTPSSMLEGCHVYWDEKKEWVEYKTRSEALVASLALCHNFPLQSVDVVVELLCNEDFKPSEVTFSNATDIYSSIGARRQLVAQKRSHPETSPMNSIAGFPNSDMFGKVLEILAEERRDELEDLHGPSFDSAQRFEHVEPDSTPIAQTLEAMSLVHRSWTIPAQKARRCFAIVVNSQPLQRSYSCINMLANPTFSFVDTILFREGYFMHDSKTWLNSPTLLKGLILHPYSRGLRTLHVDFDPYRMFYGSREAGLERLKKTLEPLTALSRLKVLSILYHRVRSDPFIEPLCDVLSRLQCLESFRLFMVQDTYHDNQDKVLPLRLKAKHPTSSLKSVNVSIKDASLLSWLTTPRAGFCLDRIGLLTSDTFEDLYCRFHPALASALQPALPFVKSLTIQCVFQWTPSAQHRFIDLRSIETASSVKTLNIRIDIGSLDLFLGIEFGDIFNHIPPSVQRLSLLFFLPFLDPQNAFLGNSRNNLDESLVQYIGRAKALRQMQVVIDDGSRSKQRFELLQNSRESLSNYWASEVPWLSLARDCCEDRGVVWSCRVDDLTRFHIV